MEKPEENGGRETVQGAEGKSEEQKQKEGRPGGRLSKRLRMLADMVTSGNRLVDVGCDHGYLSIELVREGTCPKAIAMDVREGPLAAAKAHIEAYGLDAYISVRLSDGLAEYGIEEADTCVCAGMGGRLMERILRQGMEKAVRLKELILQPQSEIPQFRRFLREAGFRVLQEDAVLEEGKYYFAMKAVYGPSGCGCEEGKEAARERLYDLYGERLLLGRHPVLLQYLLQRQHSVEKLKASLEMAGSRKAKMRLEEICSELADIEAALACYGAIR